MKKTRRQKVFCILACILLCASFFALPFTVAAEEEQTYYSAYVGYFNHPYSATVGYTLSTSYSQAYDYMDTHTMPYIRGNGEDIYKEEGYYDYEYMNYIVDDQFDPTAPGLSFGVFTLAFSDTYVDIPLTSDVLKYLLVRSGWLQFYSERVIVDQIRFSIRKMDIDTDRVEEVVYKSDPISVTPTTVDWIGSNVIYQYSFRDIRDVDLSGVVLPLRYVFCVDFGFRRSPDHGYTFTDFGFTVDTMTQFELWNFSNSLGPVGSGGSDPVTPPGDVEQLYPLYDNSFVTESIKLQNNLLAKFDSSFGSLEDLVHQITIRLPEFGTALLNISSILTYAVDDLPYIQFVFVFSLLMGLISFIFGIVSNHVGPGESKRRESKEQHPATDLSVQKSDDHT